MRILFRFLKVLLLLLAAVFCLHITAHAEQTDPMEALTEQASEIVIPPDAAEPLQEIGIQAEDPSSVLALSPESVFQKIRQVLIQEAGAPIRLCGTLLTITVLSALLNGMSEQASDAGLRRVFQVLSGAICIGTAAEPLCTCLIRAAQALESGRIFMGSYVPVFAGFLAAGGSVAGSAAYQTFVLFLTEGIMQLTGSVLYPLVQMAAALGIADALNPHIRLESIISGFHSVIKWALGFVMTMFSALLSIRSFVAASADSLAAKSVRLITSGAVPIIGSAVADAYSTVQGSIAVLRNGIGAVGMLVILWLILPPLLSLLLYRAAFRITLMFAEPSGAESMVKLCKNALHVLSAIFAMLVCFSVMLIISSAIMLMLTGNHE